MVPFQYDRSRRRLWVNCPHVDLAELQPVIQEAHRAQLFPDTLTAIIYTASAVTLIMRGPYLPRWLEGKSLTILRQSCPELTNYK